MFKEYRHYLFGFLFSVICGMPAHCHGDEPHGDQPLASSKETVQKSSSDISLLQRLYVPKGNQFKNGLLTIVAKTVERPKTVIIPAKIVASPRGYAQIHVPQLARVLVDERFPIPTTGEKVEANQVLAVVEPLLSVIDITDKRSELFRVEGEISILHRDIERLTKLGEFSPRKELENKKTALDRSEKQKEQLLSTGRGRELLRSPIDGIIGDNHVLPGQILQPNETVMEVINPEYFRIEAYTFEYFKTAQILSARLRSSENSEKFYDLKLIGTSPRLGERDYAQHILFSIAEASSELIIGMLVDVFLTTKDTHHRIVVPQKSLYKVGKSYTVFVLSGPELVKSQQVEVGLFFDQSVEIISGLKEGDRVISDISSLSKLVKSGEEEHHVH
jgi:cobalt-zinc-cadmium efflux system membrane fusion protein